MSGNVQNELALISKYKSGFTGAVPKEFSRPTPFVIKSEYPAGSREREAYGYSMPKSHPTPTDPNNPNK